MYHDKYCKNTKKSQGNELKEKKCAKKVEETICPKTNGSKKRAKCEKKEFDA